MENKFKLTISTPDESIFSGEVEALHFDTEEGSMQIFANHSSETAAYSFSRIEVKETAENNDYYFVRNAIFSFNNKKNEAQLLAIHCEKEAEINKQTAKEYLDSVKKQLEEGKDLSEFQILYLKGEQFAVEKQLESTEK